MMSRAAVYDAIVGDIRLQDLGFNTDSVLVAYDGQQRPSDTMFMVLKWEAHDIDLRLQRGPRHLAIWVHMYREFSTDFVRIDDVLDILDDILLNLVHVEGGDGRTLTVIEAEGRSRDLKDESYQTVCRSTSYRVLSRVTVA